MPTPIHMDQFKNNTLTKISMSDNSISLSDYQMIFKLLIPMQKYIKMLFEQVANQYTLNEK